MADFIRLMHGCVAVYFEVLIYGIFCDDVFLIMHIYGIF